MLSEFGDIDLGVQTLQEVQLNEMSSTAPNGYYRMRTNHVLCVSEVSYSTAGTECKVQLGGNDPNENDITLHFKENF